MGVPDKTSLVLAGVPLLDRVLAAVAAAGTLVVVGEPRPTALDVRWVREEPPGGGPAAALAAALDHVGHDLVVLLAGDLPLVQPGDVDHLLSAVVDDGAVYVDETGNEQWLCSAWRSSALRLSALGAGGSLRGALGDLRIARLATSGRHLDCDTPDDVQRVEEMLR
jgi:molybdopterin-guanine dinucleotide biosynthesis protein A